MTSLGKPITQRQLRVGEMIKQALGMLFIRDEAKLPNLSTKEITVTEVRMSPDLKNAKIFVMPLGGKNAEEIIEKLKEFSFVIRNFNSELQGESGDTNIINFVWNNDRNFGGARFLI